MKICLLNILLICSLICSGQNNCISGTVISLKSNKFIPFARIHLKNRENKIIKNITSDSLGNYKITDIINGNYTIDVSWSSDDSTFRDFVLESNDTLLINLYLDSNCESVNYWGTCPYCLTNRNSLRTEQMLVDYAFRSKLTERRFYRQQRKRGYATTTNNEGNEVVHTIYIESEQNKFYNPCYNWFCKNCKKIF